MAKAGRNKKGVADRIGRRKGPQKRPDKKNPFELRVNKQKHPVLGRKTRKGEEGRPGVARSNAIKKREATLLQEYKIRNKSNVFRDKRIGEKSKGMSPEEKMFARFAAEKMRNNKKSIYNLADDEVLTHKGQTLSEIEKFDDPRSDDEEDDNRLDAEFVQEAHFGGFLNKKEGDGDKPKSRKELIDDLIAESKKKKAERQKEKEETEELTNKLDAAWKTMASVVGFNNKEKKEEVDERRNDPYDVAVRELRFESRAKATDRLKTEEEIAREEKEQLEHMEEERLRRMRGEDVGQAKHKSADDIDDGLQLDQDEDFKVVYKDGKIVGRDDPSKGKSSDESDENDSVGDNAEVDNENDSDNEADDEESDKEDLKDMKGDAEESDSEEDDYSDIKSSSEESEDEPTVPSENALRKRKQVMEDAKKELPYTFEVPATYEDLLNLLESRTPSVHSTILERMLKCNHPSLGQRNGAKLERLFAFLLQYVHDCASDCDGGEEQEGAKCISALTPHLYDLLQLSPAANGACFRDVLQEKYQEYRKRKGKHYPGFEVLVFLKLATMLFPTSDFQHPVATPAMLFVTHLLGQKLASSRRNIAVGLFLCGIAIESVRETRRFLPEVANFLREVLSLGVPKSAPRLDAGKQLLVVAAGAAVSFPDRLQIEELWARKDPDDIFKRTALQVSLKMTSELKRLWKDLPSCRDIFEPISHQIKALPENILGHELTRSVQAFLDDGESAVSFRPMVGEKQKPKPLRLYEPKFDEAFDGRKKRIGSKEKLERDRLQHKYKRELKSTVREIRRDNSFLAQQQYKEQVQRDVERKRKVKELFAGLSVQEGEFRQLKRLKES